MNKLNNNQLADLKAMQLATKLGADVEISIYDDTTGDSERYYTNSKYFQNGNNGAWVGYKYMHNIDKAFSKEKVQITLERVLSSTKYGQKQERLSFKTIFKDILDNNTIYIRDSEDNINAYVGDFSPVSFCLENARIVIERFSGQAEIDKYYYYNEDTRTWEQN